VAIDLELVRAQNTENLLKRVKAPYDKSDPDDCSNQEV
jgi:hypothetical protein